MLRLINAVEKAVRPGEKFTRILARQLGEHPDEARRLLDQKGFLENCLAYPFRSGGVVVSDVFHQP